MIKCPFCQTLHVDNTIFCNECGHYLLEDRGRETDPLDTIDMNWVKAITGDPGVASSLQRGGVSLLPEDWPNQRKWNASRRGDPPTGRCGSSVFRRLTTMIATLPYGVSCHMPDHETAYGCYWRYGHQRYFCQRQKIDPTCPKLLKMEMFFIWVN
jgi:hypothetical protein